MSLRVAAALSLGGVGLYLAGYHLWWPLIFFGLSPVAAAFLRVERDRMAVGLAFFTGWLAMFLVQHPLWVFRVSAVGMLAAYQALTWIPIALAVRGAWRRWGIPLTCSWPIAWTAAECLRLMGPLGTPFGALGTPFGALFAPCAEMPRMLQIGELGGMHLASFPIAMVQGWFADVLLCRWFPQGRMQNLRIAAMATAGVWVAVLGFGWVRFDQIEKSLRPGPRVAVIQPDIPHVVGEASSYDPVLLREKLQRLSEAAVAQGGPVDLVVWPEGIAEFPLHNRAFLEAAYDPRMKTAFKSDGLSRAEAAARWEAVRQGAALEEARFAEWVTRLGVPVLVGMIAHRPAPPEDDRPFLKYNAAVRFDPEQGQHHDYQAKVRLYPGGEFSPWRGTFLEKLFGGPSVDYAPGSDRQVYSAGADRRRYIVRICSEMKFPKLSGRLEGGADYDFIVSPANEGMFLRNRAQVALRDCAVYRAIERRVGVVRASNSGTSGFVAPSGRAYGQVTNRLGQTRAGLGAPELRRIEELIRFRRQHEAGFATNPAMLAELNRRIEEVESVRAQAGIEGWSVQEIRWLPVKTLFERLGDWLTPVSVSLLVMLNLAGLSPRPRGRVVDVSRQRGLDAARQNPCAKPGS